MNAPSAWAVEQALSAWNSARERLSADIGDDDLSALLTVETQDVRDILARALRAADEAKGMAEAADDRMKQIQERRDRFKRQAETLRGLAFSLMDVLGETKFVLPDLTATIRAGTTAAIITDEAALPEEYVRVTRSPDRAKIAADLKQGVVIEGATLANGMPSLTVRSR